MLSSVATLPFVCHEHLAKTHFSKHFNYCLHRSLIRDLEWGLEQQVCIVNIIENSSIIFSGTYWIHETSIVNRGSV